MNLQAGARLGAYEIIAPLGAGGMGEVFRARDLRIGREVAIKVLPESVAEDRDRMSRFQREAQTAGSLNHPNLLTVHEFGADAGRPYIVSELLEGVTLRERMGGSALPQRKAIDYALQIANGLAAAHEKGIIHRDLKPENIFITRDGRVKILDFGLAKVRHVSDVMVTGAPTEARETDPGMVVGTAGYMSPEQVRGGTVDHRTDVFSLGAILYEMLSGKRAFRGTSSVDTMHAILHDDPVALSGVDVHITPALGRVVQHCLEKSPEERFQSARDLAFDLEVISGVSASGPAIAPLRERKSVRVFIISAVVAAVVFAAVGGWFVAWRMSRRPPARFTRLTFRNTTIPAAVFAPGQGSVVFSVLTNLTYDLLIATPGQPEARSVGVSNARLLAISRSNELAVLINPRYIGGFSNIGTLARLPLGGGAPRELAENVQWADWMPSGDNLLIVRRLSDRSTIEKPIGNVIYNTSGWIGSPRMSRDGQSIAFIDHPIIGDDGGYIALLDADHKKHVLTRHYNSAQGLVWSPRGDEILFTAAVKGGARVLNAVSLSGRERLLLSAPNALTVMDAAADGRLLISQSNARVAMLARGPKDTTDRELSWLDWSLVKDISPDGKLLLFEETGEGGDYSVYVRNIDGTPAVRLGDGIAARFSPDGRTALAIRHKPEPRQIFIYPVGAGEMRQITRDAITHQIAAWLPDGKRIVFVGYEPNKHNQIYMQDIGGGAPRVVAPAAFGRASLVVSPDGSAVCVASADRTLVVVPLNGGPAIPLSEVAMDARPIRWSNDGKSVFFYQTSTGTTTISKIDLATRRIEKVKDIPTPLAPYGAIAVLLSPDQRMYAYSTIIDVSDLYLLDGVR